MALGMAAIWKKKQFWGGIIGVALLAYCLKDIKPAEIRLLAERVNLYFLIPALLAAILYIYLRAMRWRSIIGQVRKVPAFHCLTLYAAGQTLGMLMPALTGQVGRVMLFSKKASLRKTFVFSTLVLEILFDAISLIVFMFVTSLAFVFPSEYRYLSFVVAGGTVIVLMVLYFILHNQERLDSLCRRRLRHRWPGVYISTKKFMRSFTKGIELLRSSHHIAGAMVYSMASWTVHMFVIWFLIKSFGFQVPFAAASVIMIVNTIVLMVPITPGNAGTFEFAVSASLAAFGVGRSDAVLFALALHMIDIIPVVLFGGLFMRAGDISIRQIKAKHEEDTIIDRIDEDGTFIEEERV